MPPHLSLDLLAASLREGTWRRGFSDEALAKGLRLAKGRLVNQCRGEPLETGDVEITALVAEKDGSQFEPVIALWEEGSGMAVDSECSCDDGARCGHAAAALEFLAKHPARLETAFGEKPLAEKMTTGQRLSMPDSTQPEPAASGGGPTFLFRAERRPNGERLAWLPERYAQAFAVYQGHRVPLSPSGSLPPVVTPEGKIARDRAAETEALRALYALDLLPGAEEPPASLRKLEAPPQEGTLWAVDKQKWPHAEFYWQRFRHEGTKALEKHGWSVQYGADFGLRPLVFRTESWRAEIVEEGRGWFQLSAGFEIDGERFELQPILATLVANRFLETTEGLPDGQEFLVFLPDGRGMALPVGRFRHLLTMLGDLVSYRFSGGGPIRLGKVDAALVLAAPALAAEAPPEVKELAETALDWHRIRPVALPEGLKASLRDYQLHGYYWMRHLARHDLHGILADDMGLGKTLQTLAHLLAEVASGRAAGLPSLVIAPTSVVENWQREAAKFAPGLRIVLLQGPDRHGRLERLGEADLALTSYALIPRDIEAYLEQAFHLLVLDEAQHVKNPDALVTRTVRRLRARHRLCLSGTPVENHLGELWSLMHFLMPSLLGSWDDFTETYRTPIERNGNESRREALARRVGPLILRRTKRDVAKELPPKTEILHTITLSETQKDLYETVRSAMDKQVRQALALRGQESQIVFLDALLKLRQICCHPSLLANQPAGSPSAKFDYLADMLDTLREEGHRVLLFSQFTSMLAVIEARLAAGGFSWLKLTGETKNRQELVERFQGGEGDVFLISLKAGGTGLTLTGADTVIHYDPWWNPAAENQATDRAYRIGQDKPVFVHKLICRNTVEERIQKMQARKDGLAAGLLSGATQQLSLTPEILEELLGE